MPEKAVQLWLLRVSLVLKITHSTRDLVVMDHEHSIQEPRIFYWRGSCSSSNIPQFEDEEFGCWCERVFKGSRFTDLGPEKASLFLSTEHPDSISSAWEARPHTYGGDAGATKATPMLRKENTYRYMATNVTPSVKAQQGASSCK
jgi:hypothetical protein